MHGELEAAKKEICKALNNLEKNYKPILNIVVGKGNGRLDSHFHWMAYLLNSYYFYKDTTIHFDWDVITSTFKCVAAFYPNDLDAQTFVINTEIAMYAKREGNFENDLDAQTFGHPIAIKRCSKNDENDDQNLFFENLCILNLFYILFC